MSWKEKVVAITPFIAVITFLLLGFLKDAWHPGWVVFLSIPLSAFIFGDKTWYYGFGLILVLAYLLIGLLASAWHPGWIIFLLYPVFTILVKPNRKSNFWKFLKSKEKKENLNNNKVEDADFKEKE